MGVLVVRKLENVDVPDLVQLASASQLVAESNPMRQIQPLGCHAT